MPRHFDDLMPGTRELSGCAAELKSFTGAAKAMNISPAAVSKTILRPERPAYPAQKKGRRSDGQRNSAVNRIT